MATTARLFNWQSSLDLRVIGFLVIVVVFGIVRSAHAAPSYEPIQLIGDVTNQVVEALETDPSYFAQNPERLRSVLDQFVSPHVDFDRVSKYLLGKYQHEFTDAQMKRFHEVVQPMLIRAYAVAIGDPTGLSAEHADARWASDGKRCAVRMRFSKQDAPSILVEYKMHHGESGWQLYDVSVAGVSFLSTYRMAIEHAIGDKGPLVMLEDLEARLVSSAG